MLIIGFALHNGTEGFGIVAPLAGDSERPSWRFLILLGIIGGGPTFFGTLVGQAWTSTAVSVCFLALAAGSILYVVMQLIQVNARLGHKTLVAWGMFGGLVARLRHRLHPLRSRQLGTGEAAGFPGEPRFPLRSRLRPRELRPGQARGSPRIAARGTLSERSGSEQGRPKRSAPPRATRSSGRIPASGLFEGRREG